MCNKKMYIAVVGAGVCCEAEAMLAERLGQLIAERGWHLVCGGGGGVMEAASRGASLAGGTVLGILPGNNNREGNRWLTIAVATGIGEARNAVIARTSDAVIAVGGEYGTLSEIALAAKMGKPVFGLQTWKLTPPGRGLSRIIQADSPEDAVHKIRQAICKQ